MNRRKIAEYVNVHKRPLNLKNLKVGATDISYVKFSRSRPRWPKGFRVD